MGKADDNIGFDVTYLPMNGGGKPYIQELKRLSDDLGKCRYIFGAYVLAVSSRAVRKPPWSFA